MRFHRLRSTFKRLVASAGLITSGGRAMAPGCCGSIEPIELNQTVDPRDPRWSSLLAACRASDSNCTPLCKVFVGNGGPDTEPPSIVECYIEDRSITATDVYVSYFFPEDCVAGRRPPGLHAAGPSARAGGELGAWLAGLAHLEAASVPAFVILAEDLRRIGAPRRLVDASIAARARRGAARARDGHARARRRRRAAHGHDRRAPAARPARARARQRGRGLRARDVRGAVRDVPSAATALAAGWPAPRVEARLVADSRRSYGSV